jgi:DNA repair exonuclease SbcCD ATPase subunit
LIGVLDKERISTANKVEETKKKWAQYNIGDEDGKEIKRPKSLIDAENKALLIREMITVLEKSMAPYREGMRKTVEKKTNTLFKLLTNQKMFKDIKKPITMSKDFKLKLHHSEGIDQGSTGQNALVSYALTLALSECSGIEFPMIIDTPFRSIGHGIKKKLLPHLLKYNRQIILIPVLDECMSMDEVEAVKKDLSTIHLVKNAKPWYSIVNELHRRD